MNKIEKLIAELCPEGVGFKELGEVCIIKTGQAVNKIDISQNPGEFPVINSGREPLGFIDKYNTEDDPIGITTRGAGVGSVTWCEGKYFRGNLNYSATINDLNQLNTRFLYHLLLQDQTGIQQLATYQGIPALNKSNLEKLKIPLPPLAIQQEIVKILDTFTTLEAELEAELETELEAREKQYEYYREELLTFGKDVEFKELGEVARYSRQRIAAADLNNENYVGVDNLLPNKQGKTKSNYVPTKGKLTRFESGDVLLGNIRPYLKKIWRATHTGGTNGDVLAIQINNKEMLQSEFLYYLLSSDEFFNFDMKFVKGAKMPRGNKPAILNFKIPIPPLAEQQRIVAILDKFDALVNDISAGLPAELNARRKQYEYYRDKLLSFKPLEKEYAS